VRELWNEIKMNSQVKVQGAINLHKKKKKKVINVSGAKVILLTCIFCPKILGIWRTWTPKVGKLSKICGIVFEFWDILLANSFFFCFSLGHKPKAKVGTIYNINIFNLDTIHLKEIILCFHESMSLKYL
jgi:hypothetical protein